VYNFLHDQSYIFSTVRDVAVKIASFVGWKCATQVCNLWMSNVLRIFPTKNYWDTTTVVCRSGHKKSTH